MSEETSHISPEAHKPVQAASSLWPTGGGGRGKQKRKSRRDKRRGSVTRGRVMLVVIFLLFRALDAWYVMGPPVIPKSQLQPLLVGSGLWLTALLLAMWLRQKWARYIFVAVMWVSVGTLMIVGSDMLVYKPMLPTFVATGVLMSLVAAWMGYSRDAHRLTDTEFK